LQQEEVDAAEFEPAAGVYPLVGRDEEVGLLRRAWQQTKEEGHGQVVFVRGEPGIGKSALVDTLRRAVRAEGLTRITFRSSPYHANSALYPVAEHWKRLAGWLPEDDNAARLGKLENSLAPYRLPREEAAPLIASLLSLPLDDRYPRLGLTPEQLKERTEDALIALSLEEAERQPLLEVWEDVHWADQSTLDARTSICGRPRRLSVSGMACERAGQGGVNSGRNVSTISSGAIGACSSLPAAGHCRRQSSSTSCRRPTASRCLSRR
jgi:hypothetical protein